MKLFAYNKVKNFGQVESFSMLNLIIEANNHDHGIRPFGGDADFDYSFITSFERCAKA